MDNNNNSNDINDDDILNSAQSAGYVVNNPVHGLAALAGCHSLASITLPPSLFNGQTPEVFGTLFAHESSRLIINYDNNDAQGLAPVANKPVPGSVKVILQP